VARLARSADPARDTQWQRRRQHALCLLKSPATRIIGGVLGVAILMHTVGSREALVGLREADGHLLLVAAGLTALSLVAGTMGWGLLVRSNGRVCWRNLGAWYAEGVAASQVLPAGVGGDIVRGLEVSRTAGAPSALASVAGARVAGAFAMAFCGLGAAIYLRPTLGSGALGGAALFAAAIVVGGVLALNAERVTVGLGGGGGRRARLAKRLRPFAATLSGFGRHVGLVGKVVVLAFAGWALQLGALTVLARSVGVTVSWQLLAVAMPLALVATWLPFTVNGVGVKEGVLVGLLVSNGVDVTHAATLSLLVDMQMVPFAAIGILAVLLPAARDLAVQPSASGIGDAIGVPVFQGTLLSPVSVPSEV
jgi:uncharacterized membrane protein YbhN (UPF0104 family)